MSTPISVFDRFEPNARLLLVASTGGHLTQLLRFARAAGVAERAVWVTFDSPQSRSLLRGYRTIWVDYIAPRDLRGTLRATSRISRALKHEIPRDARIDGVVSTGAAVAIAGFLWGKRHGVPGVYIESVSRTQGPSLTGRIVRCLHLAQTFTQHDSWASPKWRRTDSVLEGFTREPRVGTHATSAPLRVLVTLGTIRPYRFDRLVNRVLEITNSDDSIVWQLGETTREGLPGDVHRLMDAEDLLAAAKSADVVITHSGVGTILQLLDEGIAPVVVPREQRYREHVDDHQLQIWSLLTSSGVGYPTTVPDLTRGILHDAANHRTRALLAPCAPVVARPPTRSDGLFISWARENGRTTDLARALGFEARFVHLSSRFGLPGRYLRQFRETRRLLAREHPRAVILMLPPAPALLALLARRFRRPDQYGFDLHTGFFSDPKWRWARTASLRLIRRLHGVTIVTNTHLQNICQQAGLRSIVLHDLIDEHPRNETRGNYVVCPLSYANDEPIAALLSAAGTVDEIEWRFTGKAPSAVRSKAPKNVTFTGFITDQEYRTLLAESLGVVALTTRAHTMQRAGYEAFSAGVPQVTSDFPELREFYEDSAEYTAPTAPEIVRSVRRLLEHQDHLCGRLAEVRVVRSAEQVQHLEQLRVELGPLLPVKTSRKGEQ